MHYQEKMEKIFANGGNWSHSSLRTVFDPYGSEYKRTTMQEKVAILKKIKAEGLDIFNIIHEYIDFYADEKPHVIKDVIPGLAMLMDGLLEEESTKPQTS